MELNHTFNTNLNEAKNMFEDQENHHDIIVEKIIRNLTKELNISNSFKILDSIEHWKSFYKSNEMKLKKSIQIGNSKREMMNESRVVNGSGSGGGGGGGGGYERKMVKKKSRKAMIVVSTRRSSMRGKV